MLIDALGKRIDHPAADGVLKAFDLREGDELRGIGPRAVNQDHSA